MLTVAFVLLIAFPKFISFVVGDDNMVLNNSVLTSHYCFVNESTIRINDSYVNVINYTGDWIVIMASNNIDLLVAPANSTNCTSTTLSVAPYSDSIYILQIFISTTIMLLTLANVALHLFIKELQTASGALILSLCVFILITSALSLVYAALTDQRDGELCAVLLYAIFFPYFLYDASKLCTLIHFTRLMYHSYKTSKVTLTSKSILFNYATLIVVLSVVCGASLTVIDIFVSRTAFKTTNGRCTLFIDPSNFKTVSIVLFSTFVSIFNIVEIGFMIAGLIFYWLTTRQCCSRATRDVKISIALNCTIGINTGLIVVLYYLQIAGDINYAVSSSGTMVEQLLLLCVFVTSSKVLSHLHCSFNQTALLTV